MAGHASNWTKVTRGRFKGSFYLPRAARETILGAGATAADVRRALEDDSTPAARRQAEVIVRQAGFTRPVETAQRRMPGVGDVARTENGGVALGTVLDVDGAFALVQQSDGQYSLFNRVLGRQLYVYDTEAEARRMLNGMREAAARSGGNRTEALSVAERDRLRRDRAADRSRLAESARQQRDLARRQRDLARQRRAALSNLPLTTRDPQVRQAQRKMRGVRVRVDGDLVGASQTFGARLTERDIAGLVGAMDGARIAVRSIDRGTFELEVSHPYYTSTRRVFRNLDGQLEIANDYFRVRDDAPKGTGSRIVARQMEQAAALGVVRVTLSAAGYPGSETYNGYYTWPRLGYNNSDPGLIERYRDSFPPEYRDVRDLHDLFSRSGGSDWWQAYGDGHQAEFDPRPGSPHRQHLAAYLKRKGIDDPYHDP